MRDGKSFATRSVKAVQENRCIFTTIVSFHRDEPGPSYQIPLGELRALLPGKREKWVTGVDTPSPSQLIKDGHQPVTHNGMSWMSILHVAEGDRREAAELEARKLKNAVICKQQQAQLAEFRENYLERLRIEKRDGELIQKKVARISVS